MSIKTFQRVVFRQPNHNIFENDAVKIFGTVNVHGSALRGRNQYFIVFLQPLLIDGDFD